MVYYYLPVHWRQADSHPPGVYRSGLYSRSQQSLTGLHTTATNVAIWVHQLSTFTDTAKATVTLAASRGVQMQVFLTCTLQTM